MAKKARKARAPEPVETAPTAPDGFYRVKVMQGGEIIEGTYPSEHERMITVEGVHYEHVDTDPDGVWVYRNLDAR